MSGVRGSSDLPKVESRKSHPRAVVRLFGDAAAGGDRSARQVDPMIAQALCWGAPVWIGDG